MYCLLPSGTIQSKVHTWLLGQTSRLPAVIFRQTWACGSGRNRYMRLRLRKAIRRCGQSETIRFGCSHSNVDFFGHSGRNVTMLTSVFRRIHYCSAAAGLLWFKCRRENILLMLTVPYGAYLSDWPACASAQTSVCDSFFRNMNEDFE